MPSERPFLTASWTELVMLNFAVPGEVIARLAPPGTEPDYFEGAGYASVVGFMFRDAQFFGLGLPWHRRFEEVNLRYYVRREVGDAVRRGVVFVREIAPRPLVAATARWLYNESYVTRRMRHRLATGGQHARGGRRDCVRMADRPRAQAALESDGGAGRGDAAAAGAGFAHRVHRRALLGVRPHARRRHGRVSRRPSAVASRAGGRRRVGLRSGDDLRAYAARGISGGAAGAGVRRRWFAGASVSGTRESTRRGCVWVIATATTCGLRLR